MKKLLCTDCGNEKLEKDFPTKWRAETDRPWRFCTSCVESHYGKNKAKFNEDAIAEAIKNFNEKKEVN